MSDNCSLPFDVTLYIFKVSVVTVFIELNIKCNEIENEANCFRFEVNVIVLKQSAFSFSVSQKLTFVHLKISLFLFALFKNFLFLQEI